MSVSLVVRVAHALYVEADRPNRDCYALTPTRDGDDGTSGSPGIATACNRREA